MEGVEAVIDKDRASGLLAARLGVDLFIICTDVEAVFLDYSSLTRRALGCVPAAEMKEYLAAGQFPAGSMGPEGGIWRWGSSITAGARAIITSYERPARSGPGDAGTHVVP